jgi:hypothetical protein
VGEPGGVDGVAVVDVVGDSRGEGGEFRHWRDSLATSSAYWQLNAHTVSYQRRNYGRRKAGT